MSTVRKFHRSGLGVLSIVVGLCFLAVFAQRLDADTHEDQDCWLIIPAQCNNPKGDCEWKSEDSVCYRCTSAGSVNTACIFRLNYTCVDDHSAGVMCGMRVRGTCDDVGFCVGNTHDSYFCPVFPCEDAVPH